LTFSTSTSAGRNAAAVFICVGTLDQRGDWSAREVNRAVSDLASDVGAPRILVVRSTMMPGATARLVQLAADHDESVEIAVNPEFTRQGTAMNDFLHPDRVVVGLTRPAAESRALPILRAAYESIGAPVLVTDAASAEMIKTGSNVFLALKAGFANEMARLSAATGADVATVIDGIGLDKRIGRAYMTPGPGFGGSCLPSQARSVPIAAHEHGVATPIMDAIDSSNGQQAGWVVDSLERVVGDLSGKRICVLGLTFKAGTDDVRESPALRICRALAGRGAIVVAHDPFGARAAREAADRDGFVIDICSTPLDAADGADGIVVATEWPEYGQVEWARAAARSDTPVIVDARGVVDAAAASAAGFRVVVLGRPAAAKG
jgi:UDPglucose 6-dehydrogenase